MSPGMGIFFLRFQQLAKISMQKICEETEAAAGLGVPSEHKKSVPKIFFFFFFFFSVKILSFQEKLGPTSDKKEVGKRLDCSGDKLLITTANK